MLIFFYIVPINSYLQILNLRGWLTQRERKMGNNYNKS